jgi:uncharacterized protein YbaA (DUF1428 family)
MTMSYVDGFLIPVPASKKKEFIAQASKMAPILKEFGAKRVVECWGDDVPDGKVTDFKGSVKARATKQSCSVGSNILPRKFATLPTSG